MLDNSKVLGKLSPMTFLVLKILKKLIKLITDHADPKQVAVGFSCGMLLGLAPINYLYLLVIIFFVSIFKVNISGAFFGALIFGLVSYFLDPISNQIGIFILIKQKALLPFWTMLYNSPVLPWLNFNNTARIWDILQLLKSLTSVNEQI